MTITIYLNSIPTSHGGATRFLHSSGEQTDPTSIPNRSHSHTVLAKVQSVLGTATFFRDTIPHYGEELLAGVKYLLQTNMMYEQNAPFEFERLVQGKSDDDRVEKALDIALMLEHAGDRGGTVRLYKKTFKPNPALDI